MPFTPNHMSVERVEAVYTKFLEEIEERELCGWLRRLIDPAAEPLLAEITRAREAVERDLELSRERWASGETEPPPEE